MQLYGLAELQLCMTGEGQEKACITDRALPQAVAPAAKHARWEGAGLVGGAPGAPQPARLHHLQVCLNWLYHPPSTSLWHQCTVAQAWAVCTLQHCTLLLCSTAYSVRFGLCIFTPIACRL